MRTARKPDPVGQLQRLMRPRAAAALPVAPPACRVYRDADQTLTTGVLTPINLNAERWDTDTMHFTSAAALTGTVAKGAGGTTLVGTGTAFTTELSVGQMISVPGGGGTETAVVTVIANDTTATVAVGGALGTWAFTASGQTATRVNSGIVANTPGLYELFGHVRFAANATGRRQILLVANDSLSIASSMAPAVTDGAPTDVEVATQWRLSQWDFVTCSAFQSSGGNLAVTSLAAVGPEFGAARIGPA